MCFPVTVRWKDRCGCGIEITFDSRWPAAWDVRKLSGSLTLSKVVEFRKRESQNSQLWLNGIGRDAAAQIGAVRIRKVDFAGLWSHFNTSADFDIFRQNQHCWIQIVIGALVGAREAWNVLWIRFKSKLDGFGHFDIFCQNRKNPSKLSSGS